MIFLDSSFIVAYYNENDEHHRKALEIMEDLKNEKYGETTIDDYIFNECATVLLARLKDLDKTVEICEKIKNIMIFRVDEDIFEAAWKIFKEQEETKFSFIDCSTLALMEARVIKNIATFDEDFRKIEGINVFGKDIL